MAKTSPSKDTRNVVGGVVTVVHCSACGGKHDNVELSYASPPVELDGVLYTLTGTCPKTGGTLYFAITTP